MLNLHSVSAAYDQAHLVNIRNPWWLKSPAGGTHLLADFNSEEVPAVNLSFDVRMPTGTSLLSADATSLRQEIWDFLCLQGQPETYGSKGRSRLVDRRHLIRAAKVVDYFLLRADQPFALHGFRALPLAKFAQLLIDAATNEEATAGLYDWHRRLSEYLLKKAALLSKKELLEATAQPQLSEFDADQARELDLDDDAVVQARAVLFHMGMNLNRATAWTPRHLELVNATIQQELYRHTLLVPAGAVGLKLPRELKWGTGPIRRRELPGAAIAQGREDKTCSRKKVEEYRQCLLSWRHFTRFDIGPSAEMLKELRKLNVEHAVELKGDFGFEPLPPPVVGNALRDAIVFFYEHHEHLLASTARVLRRNVEWRGTTKEIFFQKRDLSAKTQNFGIRCWSTAPPDYCTQAQYVDYVRALRVERAGLLDMVHVLHGACLTIVGALEAGRQGEAQDLRADSLHATRQWVAFLSRKTGFEGLRNEDFIPAPAVVADVIEALGKFLEEVGHAGEPIFSLPTKTGLLRCDYRRGNRALDLFCDYFQVPCDDRGRRYYLRHHQLRKFFAALFFHCCGFAGLDTLRWFLRQLDAKHVWNYIRGITPGEQMRHYMAETGVLLLRDGASELQALAVLLRAKFGVSSLEVVSDKQLTLLLEQLQSSHDIEFEPIFAAGSSLEGVRLGVVIWGDLDE